MRNFSEVERRLKDAQACLGSAERCFSLGDYRVVAQNAQLCIELSAKAVIAYFEEPVWTHNPAQQSKKVLTEHGEIEDRLGEDFWQALYQLAEDSKQAAPWHGWSTYGKRSENGTWIPSVDLCTEEIAEGLLSKARHSLQATEKFFEEVKRGFI